MPFAPQIRKQILRALDDHILPALRAEKIAQVLVEPPYRFSEVEHWKVRDAFLAEKEIDPLHVVWHWEKERLTAGRFHYLGFVYEGVADVEFGLMAHRAKVILAAGQEMPPGIIGARLRAPAAIYIPPFTPGRDGSEPFYEKTRAGAASSRVLWLNIVPDGILVHIGESEPNRSFASHSLHISDTMLLQMSRLYFEELRQSTNGHKDAACLPDTGEVAQAQLFVFMSRLRRYLNEQNVSFSNTSWAPPAATTSPAADAVSNRSNEIYQHAMTYIQMHLHDSLSWESIAQAVGVSPVHLNRIFQQITGTSVMRYVGSCRIEAAKLILSESAERVDDVAKLVGFANSASFCATFRRSTGQSPNQFRRQSQGPTLPP
jgi:AraC-like DNA-binding protein